MRADKTIVRPRSVIWFCLCYSAPPVVRRPPPACRRPHVYLSTATENLIGQHTWQLGPDVGALWLGKHFIAYAFPQQWFKIGGSGPKTNQLSAILDFTYFFKSGWNIGTEPNILVNWQARNDQRVTLPVGLQVGKMCKMRAHTDLVSAAVGILPAPSSNLRSEVEHSAADNP